jgi:hypothetical protein
MSAFPGIMSALPAKAELCGAARDVCFGPIADMPRSLDNAPLYSPLRSSAWLFLGPNSLSILPPGLSELFFLPARPVRKTTGEQREGGPTLCHPAPRCAKRLGDHISNQLLTIHQLLTIQMWTLAVLKAGGPLGAAANDGPLVCIGH